CLRQNQSALRFYCRRGWTIVGEGVGDEGQCLILELNRWSASALGPQTASLENSPVAGLSPTQPMFTGPVEALATVTELRAEPPGVRLVLSVPSFAGDVALGDSVSINGCCLTVVKFENDRLEFQAGEETLSRTNLGRLKSGSQVNVERSVRAGDR